MARKSAMGVAQTIPSTPARAFIRNIKGMSRPPFLRRERIAGSSFFPTDWKEVMVSIVIEMQGPVMQMIRWNSWP